MASPLHAASASLQSLRPRELPWPQQGCCAAPPLRPLRWGFAKALRGRMLRPMAFWLPSALLHSRDHRHYHGRNRHRSRYLSPRLFCFNLLFFSIAPRGTSVDRVPLVDSLTSLELRMSFGLLRPILEIPQARVMLV
jgi:hypothetical protein